MSTTNPPQLFLLADHIKLSLLERQRAISLNLPSHAQDGQISRSLEQLRSGIESLESQTADNDDESISSQIPRLRTQLKDLSSQFTPSATTPSTTSTAQTLNTPNNSSLTPDFTAAQKKPRQSSKSVRFTDSPSSTTEDDDPNRAQLFPYRDDPDPDSTPNHENLSNQQIHSYHSSVIAEQDAQLDQLGLSIGRQRELSMQIGDELEGQVLLLDDVEEGVDRHQAQFVRARGRLDRIGRKARENWSLTVIICLIVVLVLLIVITK